MALFAAAIVATAVQAAPTPITGSSNIVLPQPPGSAPPTVPTGGQAASQRNLFEFGDGSTTLPALTGVTPEDFEGFDLRLSPDELLKQPLSGLFGGKGSISGLNATSLANDPFAGDTFSGRWNTTSNCSTVTGGCNWFSTSSSFTLAFGQAVSAFGFYGTDFGDFNATITMQLLDEQLGDVAGAKFDLLETGGTNGNLLFYGIRDMDAPGSGYGGVRFEITQTSTSQDIFGFDDFMIGNVAQVDDPDPVPEPGTLALAGLALAGLAASRRRSSR